MDERRRRRVDGAQALPERLVAQVGGKRLVAFAHDIADLVALRKLVVIDSRPDVKPRPSAQDSTLAALVDVNEARACIVLEQRGGIRLPGVAQVKPPVWHASVGNRNLPRPDVHATVDLHRIRAHDLARKLFGNPLRKRRLAGCRRADYADNGTRKRNRAGHRLSDHLACQVPSLRLGHVHVDRFAGPCTDALTVGKREMHRLVFRATA